MNLKIPSETFFSPLPLSPFPFPLALLSSSHASSLPLSSSPRSSLRLKPWCKHSLWFDSAAVQPSCWGRKWELGLSSERTTCRGYRNVEGGGVSKGESGRERKAELKTVRKRETAEKEDRWQPIMWLSLVWTAGQGAVSTEIKIDTICLDVCFCVRERLCVCVCGSCVCTLVSVLVLHLKNAQHVLNIYIMCH